MEWVKQRLTFVLITILMVFCVLFSRLAYLQIISGTKYRQLSANNCIRLQTIDAPRGLIFDRNGEMLVDNRPSFDLAIIPKDADPITRTIAKLAAYTGVPAAHWVERLGKKKYQGINRLV